MSQAIRKLVEAAKAKDHASASRAMDTLIQEERSIRRRNRDMFGPFLWRYWLDRYYRWSIIGRRADYDEACERLAELDQRPQEKGRAPAEIRAD